MCWISDCRFQIADLSELRQSEIGNLKPRMRTMSSAATDQSWTIGELLDWTVGFLGKKGVESPRLDAQVLLAKVLGCKRIDLYGQRYGETASEEVKKEYRSLIRRRLEGCPVAYLVGRKDFFSLEFDVSPAVLIPRPDSELVVTECLDLARKQQAAHILDIGAGSGNLAVALAYHLPAAEVTAVDVSEAALAVARSNAQKHGVTGRIRFLQGDVFAPIPAGQRFDFIVSNPPYIPRSDLPALSVGVRDYEPALALDGGETGFAVFDRIIQEAQRYLTPGGHLILEIGSPQEKPARQRLEQISGYQLAPTVIDLSGHPRVLKVQYPGQ
jgi:release factor glutamine methyltransferase